MGADTRPNLPPRLHSLFTEFAPIRYPQDATIEVTVSHGLDYCLNCYSGLARSCWHTDQRATMSSVGTVATQPFAHVAHHVLLIAMKLRKPVPAFDFNKWVKTTVALASPLGGKPERLDKPDGPR